MIRSSMQPFVAWVEPEYGVSCLYLKRHDVHLGQPMIGSVSKALAAGARHLKATGKQVLTFVGYSGAGYQDPDALMQEASRILDRHDPARTLINSGGTAEGIGQILVLAKGKGFATLGVVSSLARQERVPLSPCVDTMFYVPDKTWGGELPQGKGQSPTSSAIVRNSDAIVGIGGGEIARDVLLAARRAGKPVTFIPADMNHKLAREKARLKGRPEPKEFGGAAAAVAR